MNKHEETLHNLRQFVELFGEGYPQDVEDFKLNECVKSFGELVEEHAKLKSKATPKKPDKYVLLERDSLGFPTHGYCKKCGTSLLVKNNYCGRCGQALDWSDEDEC